ncbi:cysteine-rich with EGF-like domain protein 2 isoform X2 [Scleropages formosus]|uniref:cysteine-rich with EGF-like domain protein 2 isoform X2 n=1 Tax=Scleropages formosus TaxID=113540 RepID=UPI0010FAA31B|nr:cysteine-rich with EGF-like domain protein 2 isoform X2 [Scleropages formosus]
MRYSMGSAVILLYALTFILHTLHTDAVSAEDSCSTCRGITINFSKGFERTAKKNFGGGNTAWEERKLSKYETSEIRLVEILETLCESSSFECNRMVEEHEEHFETWWFRWKTEHPDLFKWFCINTIKVCCPKGTYGPDCNACVGGSERPCHGNGLCDGDGTRGGQGTCTCNHGYQGELCLDCVEGYFSEERNDTHAICTECHTSCKTCAGPSNGDCEDCKAGWEKDQQGACIDVDECSAQSPPCKEDQLCVNTDGSYSCKACDKACSRCRGEGPDQCLACAEGYQDEDGTCADIDECSLPERVCPGEHRECVNIKGSFRCFCSSGFEDHGGVCLESQETEADEDEMHTGADSEPTSLHTVEHEDL